MEVCGGTISFPYLKGRGQKISSYGFSEDSPMIRYYHRELISGTVVTPSFVSNRFPIKNDPQSMNSISEFVMYLLNGLKNNLEYNLFYKCNRINLLCSLYK